MIHPSRLPRRSHALRLSCLALGLCTSACGAAHGSEATRVTEPATPEPQGAEHVEADAALAAAGEVCAPPSAEIQQLVRHLDDDYDELHSDITPSVLALIAAGLPGACAVRDALEAPEPDTRMHAQRVFEGVAFVRYGWHAGWGFGDQIHEERSRAALVAVDYAYDASPERRAAGAERWRRWLSAEAGANPPSAELDAEPVTAAMTAALDAVLPALRRCGEPVDLRVSFARTGAVESIYRSDSTAAHRACVTAATDSTRVPAFDRDSLWVHYSPHMP